MTLAMPFAFLGAMGATRPALPTPVCSPSASGNETRLHYIKLHRMTQEPIA
jgi:hypothetical protein